MQVKSYKELEVWNKGIEMVESIYRITKNFPQEERFVLVVQMRRAASSIPTNIAEGFRRKHNKEFSQFLHISLGSCAELETQLIISSRLGYMSEEDTNTLLDQIDHIGRMLTNFLKKL